MTFSENRYGLVVLISVVAILVAGRPAGAQESAPELPPPYLTVGSVDASPGASVIVPLYYTPDPHVPLRSFTVDIEFVSNNLAFQDATNGIIGEEALKIASSVKTGEPDAKGVKRSKIHLSATAVDADQGLPEGLLSYLLFNLSIEAKPFAIKLSPTVVSAQDTAKPARTISKLGAQPGLVTVLSADAMPEMTCFFFTH